MARPTCRRRSCCSHAGETSTIACCAISMTYHQKCHSRMAEVGFHRTTTLPTSRHHHAALFFLPTIRASQLLQQYLYHLHKQTNNVCTTPINRRARATNRRACARATRTSPPSQEASEYHNMQVERVDRDARQRPTYGGGEAASSRVEKLKRDTSEGAQQPRVSAQIRERERERALRQQ